MFDFGFNNGGIQGQIARFNPNLFRGLLDMGKPAGLAILGQNPDDEEDQPTNTTPASPGLSLRPAPAPAPQAAQQPPVQPPLDITPQGQPQPAPQPSFIDRLKGLAGDPDTNQWLSSMGIGLMSGRNWGDGLSKGMQNYQQQQLINSVTAQQRAKQQQQQGVLQGNLALVKRVNPNLSDQEALAYASNPSLMADVAKRASPSEQYSTETDDNGNMFSVNKVTGQRSLLVKSNKDDPKYGVIGEDAFGRKKFGWMNPSTQTVTPNETPQGAAAQAPSNLIDLHGEEFLKALEGHDKGVATQVRGIVDGRLPYPTGMFLRTPQGQMLAQYVTQADPTFEAGNASSRVKLRTEFNTGINSPAGVITAGNTAIQHLGHLSDAAEKLGNYDTGIPGNNLLNSVANAANVSRGKGESVIEFNNILNKYAEEVTKFYRGTGGAEADIKRELESLNANLSPSQLRTALRAHVDLINSKINALQDRWKNGMGPLVPDFPIVHDESRKALDRITSRADGQSQSAVSAAPQQPAGQAPAPGPAKRYRYDGSGNLLAQ